MKEYNKIDTVYERDVNGTKKLIEGKFRKPVVEFLKDCEWEWTEKIDGTNIRVYWDGHTVTFGGRTDRANIPSQLVNRLNQIFGGENNAQIFEQLFGEKEVLLFGEGYGNKIQSVGEYYISDDVNFILFDVMINDMYLDRKAIEGIARAFNISSVSVVGYGTIDQAVAFIKERPKSVLAEGRCEMEGIVCRPVIELKTKAGERVIVKIKSRDFE